MQRRSRIANLKYKFAILFNRIVPQWLFRMRRYVVYEMDIAKTKAVAESQKASPDDNVQVSACQTEAQVEAVETLTWFKRAYSSGKNRSFQATNERSVGSWRLVGK